MWLGVLILCVLFVCSDLRSYVLICDFVFGSSDLRFYVLCVGVLISLSYLCVLICDFMFAIFAPSYPPLSVVSSEPPVWLWVSLTVQNQPLYRLV